MTPTERLRRDTRDAHRRLERCRFGRALVEARVDRQDYVDYLRALTVLVATLATQIRRHGAPDDRTVGAPLAGWAKLLQRDLADLVAPATPANLTASDAALEGARRVRLAVGDGTARLLGWLYVLRGSHRGNRTVADGVTRALGLVDSAGTRYLRATAGEGDDGWRACREALDRSLLEERRFAAALAGAEDAFATFQRLLEAIGPEAPRAPHVTALNPEAGDHAIVAEPRLIELASEAADRAMSALPYLGLRFGERGALYARSDSAWLVTLCELPTAFAEQQADWLGALLSARGLPTLCLEAHLRVLADVLAPALPEAKLATFRRLADRIAARRGDVLPEERFAAAADLVLPPLGARSGQLLLAAAADQAAGVAACADSLRAWVVGELEVDAEARDALLRFLDDALAEALP